jgi:thiamine transport system substrate-binding protein
MKHFLFLLAVVFTGLIIIFLYRDDSLISKDGSILKIYASDSFIAKWGPGPQLKEIFEKQTGLKLKYLEMMNPQLTFQKMNFDGAAAMGDVVTSLDQYDLVRSKDIIKWKKMSSSISPKFSANLPYMNDFENFVPYNWAPISFVVRSDFQYELTSLNDLFHPELKGKIALQDPRTSSPGLQFLAWVMQTRSEADAVDFFTKMNTQVHSYSAGWSASYGLFTNKQADLVLSYVTSPIYHLLEEKNSDYRALEFKDGHPIQIEFVGIPETCQNCEAAIKFVKFMQSPEAQKIIMAKNYMLPIYKPAQEATAFDTIKIYKLLSKPLPTKDEIQRWLNIWTDIRKDEG